MVTTLSRSRFPWGAIGVLGMVTIVGYGVAYYAYGVLIEPIRAETRWPPTALGAIFSGVLLVGGIGGLAGGRLFDRVGNRVGFVLAGTVGAGAIALSSAQTRLMPFALAFVGGCGLIGALGFYQITQPAAIRIAPETPARAVVWLTVLGAFSSPIFLPLTAQLVHAIGWRGALRVEAGAAAIAFLAAAVIVDARPRGQEPVPAEGVADALRAAWRAPGFRRWILASLIGGGAAAILLVYQVPAMVAAGLPLATAASVAGLRGLAQLGGRLPLSLMLHRFSARQTLVFAFLFAAVAALLLLLSHQLPAAVAYSLFAGASLGAISTLQGIHTHELVEPRHLGMLLGAQQAVLAVGAAMGPLLAGTLLQAYASYTPVVLITAAAFLVAAVVLATSRSHPASL